MATNPYSLKNDYTTGAPPSASDLNRRANILRAQIPGALEAFDEGVLPVPDDTSLQVIYDAGAAYVDIGAAYVRHENGHLIYLQNLAENSVANYESGIVNYVFIVAYLSDDPLVHDSETARLCRLIASDSDTYPGGLLLGEIAVDGTVTDRRTWVTPAALALRVTQLETDLGYDAGERAKGTVAARLNLLASDEGSGEGVATTFLEQLKYSVADPRNAVVVIEEKLAANLAAAVEAATAGGEFSSPSETDQIWGWLLGLRRTEGKAAPNLLRFLPGSGAEPGLHGTASAPDTEQFDLGGTLPAVPEEREYSSE